MSAAPLPSVTKVVGVVTDSVTGERLSFVNVYSKAAKAGTTTDQNGVFSLNVPVGTEINVSLMGYATEGMKARAGRDTMRFLLHPEAIELEEVVVKPKKQKYSKKNNPAVDLMQRVRADRKTVNPRQEPYYSYDRYDKMVVGLNNYKGYVPGDDGQVKGRLKQLAELVDTGVWTGSRILDISFKEKFATQLYSSEGVDKEIVIGERSNGLDKGLDQDYTRVIFEDMLREVDVYGNDIPMMRAQFVSPLSAIGADYYMYHIEDTVMIGNDRCIELSFAPHNPESLGFNGKLYIPVNDSVKWVRRVLMRLPKAANVNFVESMYLSQTFNRDSLGKVHKTLDDIVVELHLVGAIGEAYMARQSRYDNHSYERRTDLDEYYGKIGNLFQLDASQHRPGEFWTRNRMIPLSRAESVLAKDESPFRKIPILNLAITAVELVVKGYVGTSTKASKFDFGPIDSFVSYDGIEGLRLKVGGLTTANLSKHLFARAYVAYGFHDNRWKYEGELEYSFNPKKYHSREFPMNGIRFAYRYDINSIGQSELTNSARNLLNSITRMTMNLSTYERLAKLEYNIEWRNNLSFNATIKSQRQESSKYVPFTDANGASVAAYTENSIRLQLRWAPNEKYIQTFNERRNVNHEALYIILSHEFGPKGLFGSAFTINRTDFFLQKRVWMSMFGYFDVIFKAAKLWNQVQFPALLWQNANIAYTVQNETYSLLNPMEFAMDQYASVDFTYNMNGLILNRIPLVKKLRLRELITFKAFAGSLTKKNNPEYNDNLYRFPNTEVTHVMGKTPYMEIGVGLGNILNFLRIDYVWRLTYRNTPGAPNSGLRFSFMFAF